MTSNQPDEQRNKVTAAAFTRLPGQCGENRDIPQVRDHAVGTPWLDLRLEALLMRQRHRRRKTILH
jgi:hypothetical protein